MRNAYPTSRRPKTHLGWLRPATSRPLDPGRCAARRQQKIHGNGPHELDRTGRGAQGGAILMPMQQPLRARVRHGRIILDEPTDLPDGTELELVIADGGDDLDDKERAALHRELELAMDDVDAGRVVSEEEVRAKLRALR